jgi:hypothetical protein
VKKLPKKELKNEWDIEITEGDKPYTLHLQLFKSRLNIDDGQGNKIAIDKRDNAIKIQRWGNVEWHRGEDEPK